ncbi:hypothetical protein [Granulicella sibirica]|uniref:Uncharacterized protein n=1 Tax=Granulicella sibirica TaxID=2479048 RepID=A0A4Q0T342_9BACT|nr:hypothetical protein [Granulicella sibirica]RXH55946.1 hypothetical protein GRAN_2803 [Granulicella sibirica]
MASAAVDPNSAALIAKLGTSKMHADFGAGEYDGSYMGIPYIVVSGQAKVKVNYQAYGSESDAGPMPIPASTLYEGYPSTAAGDRHVLVLDRDNCFLYELDDSYLQSDGSWNADSGAVWDITNNNSRPYQWTSADAAGLPIFPGLARYDEVASGQINHALRFTVASSRKAFVAPATHWASTNTATNLLPMGARLRLKATYDISTFTPQTKVILTALKTYGMIVADNGSNLYLSGTPDSRWNNDDLHELGTVPASAFEVVTMGTPIIATTIPKGTSPVISALKSSATAAVASGTAVTLTWAATGSSYYVLSPEIGAVRGTAAAVHPTVTTTYTLVANNHFGSTTKLITVTVK